MIRRYLQASALLAAVFTAPGNTALAQNISDEAVIIGYAIADGLTNLPGRPPYFQADSIKYKDVSTSMLRAKGEAIVWSNMRQVNGPLHIPGHVKVGYDRFKIVGLGEGCLEGCDMTSVNIPVPTRTVPARCFSGCSNLADVYVPGDVTFIENAAFRWCASLKTITLPSGLKYIGDFCFDQSGLESFVVPKSVEYLGNNAFNGCRALRSITFTGHRIECIGGYVFQGCTALTDVTLPPGCGSIMSYAFAGSGLKRLSWPKEMGAVYPKAFEDTEIERIDSHAATPPKIAWGTFTDADTRRIKLHVPAGRTAAYRAVPVWNRFTHIIDDL